LQGTSGYVRDIEALFKCANGSIPAPLFDLCSACAEKRSYKDHNGILRAYAKEQPYKYQASAPEFVPLSFCVPSEVLAKSTFVHKEYLRLVFNVIFL